MAFDGLTLESFVWGNTMRGAHAVSPNLAPPSEERLHVRAMKPLAHSKYRRRRCGDPPRRHQMADYRGNFCSFVLALHNIWRIERFSAQKIFRKGVLPQNSNSGFPPCSVHWEESRCLRRQSFATICSASARKQIIVWRRGEEFERLLSSF
jgi:hypothetical protein